MSSKRNRESSSAYIGIGIMNKKPKNIYILHNGEETKSVSKRLI